IAEVQYVPSADYGQDKVISASIAKGEKVEQGQSVLLTVSLGNAGTQVPDVAGKSYEEAEAVLRKGGFEVVKEEEYNSDIEVGRVIAQLPQGGELATEGASITLYVSLGEEESKVKVPDLRGREEDEAMAILIENNLVLGNVEYVDNEEYPQNKICYQSYSVDTYVEKGTMIDIRVSRGPSAATYSFSGNILGPTLEEDPGFKNGTSVQVTIRAADGTVLMDMATTSFPFSVNYSGIKSESGTISFHYFTTAADGTQQEMNFSRDLLFTKEN
ncbi:MAG: PASTA domain-containing protein, partial [Clostridiales bacterium]|nr:PASTA domain-containing protein [Clostridiales bacterium]